VTAGPLAVLPVAGLPEVAPGDDLARLVAEGLERAGLALVDGDVVVVASKVVSKAEGALLAPRPGEAIGAARRRLAVEGARRVVVDAPFTVITETRHGLVCANGGLDASNVPDGAILDLPDDPDASARRLRAGLRERTGARVAVIVSDTFGRPWRMGQTDVAIGAAGIAPIRDERGTTDREGRTLDVTEAAIADELAGAADLVRRKGDGVAVVVVRGLDHVPDAAPDASGAPVGAAALVRPSAQDLFPRGRGALADALAAGGEAAPATAAMPPPAVLDRALAAARGLGGDGVDLVVLDGPTRVEVRGPERAAGLAAGALVAAVLDLGGAARVDDAEAGLVVALGWPSAAEPLRGARR
jgi:coenzyme F420-0:L-glutamate ligase / coenzyme F420-1:gamma-L-glutamate ligase